MFRTQLLGHSTKRKIQRDGKKLREEIREGGSSLLVKELSNKKDLQRKKKKRQI